MRNTFALMVGVCLISLSTAGWAVAQQPRPVADATTIDDVLKAIRADQQSTRADIIAKNVTLTAAQAAQFWPMFDAYQREQNVVLDDQLKGIQQYLERFDSLDDAAALSLINAHFDRDAKMVAIRKQWLGEFQKVLGAKLAVRVMQIDRRLSLVYQLQFTTKIPLAE